MQNDQQPPETWNVSGGEAQKNKFDRNKAPIIKDSRAPITINNYYANTKVSSDLDLDSIRDGNANTSPFQENRSDSNEAMQIRNKLDDLLSQKRELEIQLESVRSQINQILKGEINSKLINLLNWLADRHQLAEKYGRITLRGFQNLKQEAEVKGNLDDFFFQIESYLELVDFSLRYDNKIFLQEPPITPTFADPDVYVAASPDIYKEVFRILKENIPKSNVDICVRSKLEDHFDELLERLQTYF